MNSESRLTSVVFRLTRQKLSALKELSRSTRVRQSEYLREAIEDVLVKYDGAEMTAVVAEAGGMPELSLMG